jgi:hypothetical protein
MRHPCRTVKGSLKGRTYLLMAENAKMFKTVQQLLSCHSRKIMSEICILTISCIFTIYDCNVSTKNAQNLHLAHSNDKIFE